MHLHTIKYNHISTYIHTLMNQLPTFSLSIILCSQCMQKEEDTKHTVFFNSPFTNSLFTYAQFLTNRIDDIQGIYLHLHMEIDRCTHAHIHTNPHFLTIFKSVIANIDKSTDSKSMTKGKGYAICIHRKRRRYTF